LVGSMIQNISGGHSRLYSFFRDEWYFPCDWCHEG
jgi:hypothetical protein